MRYVWVLCILFSCFTIAQQKEKEAVKASIELFFEGFHAQDSMMIKSVLAPEAVMQRIGEDAVGKAIVAPQKIGAFLKSIVSIPKTTTFQEKIMSFNIQIDGNMANAWTPYEFWRNGTFSHCGVNSFQLFKDQETWKIIYIVDTRRKENCSK